jgi:hypothetical protein
MQFRINTSLDLASFARTYAEDGLVQIPNLFDEETAAHIEGVLVSLPWRLVCQDDTKKNVILLPEQVRAMTAEERSALDAGIR